MQKPENAPSGILYMVATPIGNLEDITLRALRVLKEVDLIAAEDTRHTRRLLDAYAIVTPMISLHEHNEKARSALLMEKLACGRNVAYVSDAGTPCISDPGRHLVAQAHHEQIRVVPVPGPSALITALSASGFQADHFLFCGFLPPRSGPRRKFLESIKDEEATIIFYESPTRFTAALADAADVFGDRLAVVGRELTKMFEEIRRGRLSEFCLDGALTRTKGEFTVVVSGAEKNRSLPADEEIETMLEDHFKKQGLSLRDAVDQVAGLTGVSRKKVYALAVGIDRQRFGNQK
ncbi:MAG: 16S rRNA (cytidine(1402)-2'-O)-methyltransferase [Smithellaceae bacterium]